MNNRTIKEAQQWASSFLKKHNIEQAELEAEVLMKTLHNWERSQLFLHWDDKITSDTARRLEDWVERRVQHEPLQYIIGTQSFFGREFIVNESVLIPRPETELLLEKVFQEIDQQWQDQPIDVVDIGTGSGAIAITMALEKKNATVHTVDISQPAIGTATKNADKLKAKVKFHYGSLLEPIIQQDMKVDLIISNPPYIPSKDVLTLMVEVKDHEPILALDGGEDGLNFYRQIIEQSKQVLKHPGIIAFEIGINQAADIKELLLKAGAFKVEITDDLQSIPRIVIAHF